MVLISALVFGMMFSESGPPRIDTSAAMTQINDGNVESAKLLNNERMELTLKTPYTSPDGTVKDAKTVYAYYVDARGGQVVQALNAKAPPKGVDDQIDQPSWFGSFLFSVLPVILILGLFWFLMGQMQGGGNRVMQFGKSRAKLATKDTPKV
ncbi:MAG TPA: ATP-dependent metallopeptidase FtsH/Yme1/Tma family protein, partial [Terrabacter sp.]|nr:ATP-dependent metallopeptidase FtsH/Yme1/Tma family protein [Terrabacter sp.]